MSEKQTLKMYSVKDSLPPVGVFVLVCWQIRGEFFFSEAEMGGRGNGLKMAKMKI